ncbi:hypothetical protein ACFLSX_04345 [Calditrichota bacterium]
MKTIIIKKNEKRTTYQRKLKQIKSNGIDAYRYCGKIDIDEDPLLTQRKLRDEWK